MSWQAREWWELHAPVRGAQWAVGMVLAGHAHADGTGACVSKETIAAKANLDEKTVRLALAKLMQVGIVSRGALDPRYRTRIWNLVMDDERFPLKKLPGAKRPHGGTAPTGETPLGATASGGRGIHVQDLGAPRPSEQKSTVVEPPRARANGRKPRDENDAALEALMSGRPR